MIMPKTEDALLFYKRLKEIIEPKDSSDRTTFLKIACWIECKVLSGEFRPSHYEYILECARDSCRPDSRNPAAVFISILQRELGYGKRSGTSSVRQGDRGSSQ